MLLGIWHEKPPPWINLLRNTQYCKWVISDCAAKVFQCNSVSPTELMCKVKIAASLKMDNYRLFKGFWSFPSLWSALTPFKRSCFLCQYVLLDIQDILSGHRHRWHLVSGTGTMTPNALGSLGGGGGLIGLFWHIPSKLVWIGIWGVWRLGQNLEHLVLLSGGFCHQGVMLKLVYS